MNNIAALSSGSGLDTLIDAKSTKKKPGGDFDALLQTFASSSFNQDAKSRTAATSTGLESPIIGGALGYLLNFSEPSKGVFDGIFGSNDLSSSLASASGFPTISSGFADLDSIIGTSGPLPSYLKEVVASKHLDAAHARSLYEITARHMDIVKTPDSVAELAGELTQAGI
jgi:hypothetical protein